VELAELESLRREAGLSTFALVRARAVAEPTDRTG
jgi:hypothetical protein